MRKLVMGALLLLVVPVLGACSDIVAPGHRSVDGEWSARADGDVIWLSLRDDRGRIHGSGGWGYDDFYVTGERHDSEVYLILEFNRYNPIEFEGRIRDREIDGRLYGSGYDGERVRFRRDSHR